MSNKPFPALFNTASGNIFVDNAANAPLAKKPTVIRIQAVVDEDSGEFINANGEANIQGAVNSKSLSRIASSLQSLKAQRDQLLAAGLAVPGGEAMLTTLDLYDVKVDGNVAVQPDPDVDPELEAMKKVSGSKVSKKTKADLDSL